MKLRTPPTYAKTTRAHRLRKTLTTANAAPPRRPAVRVLIAYGDVPSARNAIARIDRLLRATACEVELHPMLWRFDQLDDPRWREIALRDAAGADALVLAMSGEADFCPRTEAWMTALLNRMRGASLTVLALVGEDDAWTVTLAQPAGHARSERDPKAAAVEVFASAAPKRMAACAA